MPQSEGPVFISSVYNFDHVSRTDGYSAVGNNAYGTYSYSDNAGNTYTISTAGSLMSVIGKNGYYGTGNQATDNLCYYTDNKGNNCTITILNNCTHIHGKRESISYYGMSYKNGNSYYYIRNK